MTSESVTRGPRQKSWLWCFGASVQRVLPLIAICVITGVLSDVAYNPAIGGNSVKALAPTRCVGESGLINSG